MKNILFTMVLSLVFFTAPVKAQDIQISSINQVARVHSNVIIDIDIAFLDSFFQKQLESDFSFPKHLKSYYTTTVIPNDTGDFKIGPYEFIFNDKTYKTNSITIKVLPLLEEKEAVYIHLSKYRDDNILTIEQVYKYDIKPGAGYDSGMGNLVELKSHNYSEMNAYERMSEDTPLNFRKPNRKISSFHYSIKTYVINNYNIKSLKLSKANFRNLPENFVLPDLIIK